MRRLVYAFSVILCMAPAVVSAQWLPGLFNMDSCESPIKITGYVGWIESQSGRHDSQHWEDQQVTYWEKTGFRGPYVGLALETALTDQLDLIASGGALLGPTNEGTLEEVTNAGLTDHFIESRGEWWTHLDGIAAYSLSPSDSFRALFGFRWEHYTNSFDLENQPPGNLSVGEYLVTSNTYIPFIGVDYTLGSNTQTLLLRVACSPLIFGYTEYALTEDDLITTFYTSQADGGAIGKGWFAEVLFEFRKMLEGIGNAGLYVKWNHLRSECYNIDTEVELSQGGIPIATITDTVDTVFQRSHWTLGGSLTLDFSLL